MEWVLTVVLGVMCLGAIAAVILLGWFHYKERNNANESHDDVISAINEGILATTNEHARRMVQTVMEFTARLSALEELALIESKERREYLKLAEVKMQERQVAIHRAKMEGKPVIPADYYTESEEFSPDPIDGMLASGSRRGRPVEVVEEKVEEKDEASA